MSAGASAVVAEGDKHVDICELRAAVHRPLTHPLLSEVASLLIDALEWSVGDMSNVFRL